MSDAARFQLEPAIEIETAPNPTMSVIWMHGLGADGNDFVPIVPELKLPKTAAIRFIFPHAPMMPVTCNNGYVMRAWFDILSMAGGKRDIDESTIIATVDLVRGLIAKENARGIPSNRIVLCGFSQGGAMAYTVGLTHPETLAGMVALSGYIPAPQWVENNFKEANRSTPIFAAHGTQDEVLPIQLGEAARDLAQKLNSAVEWHTWGMPHTVCLEEILLLGEWLGHVAA
ncbi:MAG TPA: alpha/beta hydrolase [Rhodocyclaceae bacterium]|jgi:phospholipase/carboxylesterase|nr:alpha/beta hydrolase [Rhodocyclaceae bacterium]